MRFIQSLSAIGNITMILNNRARIFIYIYSQKEANGAELCRICTYNEGFRGPLRKWLREK